MPGQYGAYGVAQGQGAACAVDGMCDATYGDCGSGLNLACAGAGIAQPGVIVGAEWLYWTTDPNVSYATINNATGRIAGRRFKGENTGLRGRFGFRSAAGWDLIGTFTWFNEGEDGRFSEADLPTGHTLTNARLGAHMNLTSIESRMKTDLQTIDIEMGRWADYGQTSFRIFGGVRWTGLTEDISDHGEYTLPTSPSELLSGEIAVLDSSSALTDDALETDALLGASPTTFAAATPPGGALTSAMTDRVGTTSRLNAFGVRLGIETRIGLFNGFGLYGKGAGALAAGRVKSSVYVNDVLSQDVFKKTYLTPSVDAGLGLYWRLNGLEARAGYEFNGWYNSGNVYGKKTDFLAHGVVAGLGYNY